VSIEVAKTIQYQIKVLDKLALISWGAKDFLGFPETEKELGALQFSVRNVPAFKGIGYVKISLNGNDLYDIEVYKKRNITKKVKDKLLNGDDVELKKTISSKNDVYVEDLVNTIDNLLGIVKENNEN